MASSTALVGAIPPSTSTFFGGALTSIFSAEEADSGKSGGRSANVRNRKSAAGALKRGEEMDGAKGFLRLRISSQCHLPHPQDVREESEHRAGR